MLLEKVHSPADIRKMSYEELSVLAREIRTELITTVAHNGGHLASNLGIVELTLAIHRVFNTPEDRIVFDVGHQSYVHKLITGRYAQFSTLRKWNGLSGFPKRSESPYDIFETGHASTAISAALGLARARDCLHEDRHILAVVGDGALTGGMCYEALNDAGNSDTRLMVILNDNNMSIAANTGALSRHLTDLRVSSGWRTTKARVRRMEAIPVIGKPLYRTVHGTKKMLKTLLLRGEDVGFFETLGFHYFGPIDGHDQQGLEHTLRLAKDFPGPCIIHVVTCKGYGYEQAENRPETFHGTPPFYVETGDRRFTPPGPSCGHVMADALAEMAATDERILAITAAMKLGTGLDHFEEKYPERVLDTGITEEHAATMAAGLAAGGMRPYFAVYASFFQRCHDQMIHDVAMQGLPVTFLLDRAGLGGEDGQTHHGLFDFASLLPVPGMTVLAPCCTDELVRMIRWTLKQDGPVAIRYPRSLPSAALTAEDRSKTEFRPGRWERLKTGRDCELLAVGSMVQVALETAVLLWKSGIDAGVVNCSSVKPLDKEMLRGLHRCFTLEEHMQTGGFGAFVCETCATMYTEAPLYCFAVGDSFVPQGEHGILMDTCGLTAEKVAARVIQELRKKGTYER